MKRVEFEKNGFVTELNDDIAERYAKKKRVKILGSAKTEKPADKPEAKDGAKK